MAIHGLYLVQLMVADWPASLAWYRDRLGLPVVLVDERHRFALLQAGAPRLALKEGRPELGSMRLTFEVDGLAAELVRLAGHGIVPRGPIETSPEGYRQVLLRDPDGYDVCLFEWA